MNSYANNQHLTKETQGKAEGNRYQKTETDRLQQHTMEKVERGLYARAAHL